MSLFIDTGVFYAHHDRDATRHAAARSFFDVALGGELGQPYTNDYVFDEVVTLTRRRTGGVDTARSVADRILGNDPFPAVVRFEYVTPDIFEGALDILDTYANQSFSFTDAIVVAHCQQRSIDRIVSFDDDFDGVFERLDPRSVSE